MAVINPRWLNPILPEAALTPAFHAGSGPAAHLAHANGYPPLAYRPLMEQMAQRMEMYAFPARPLWSDQPVRQLRDWQPLAGDLLAQFAATGIDEWIAIGHSVGGNASLRAALHEPRRFKAVILIDPVLFPPWFSMAWKLIYAAGLGYRLHPLAPGALRRRSAFDSRQAMFENYRRKPVFSGLDDNALWAYVDSLAARKINGGVHLAYPPAWEARVYVTSMLADLPVWRALPDLQPPLLILRGEHTDTFWESTAALVQKRLPTTEIHTLPDCGHLLALEKPAQVASLIFDFLERQGLLETASQAESQEIA